MVAPQELDHPRGAVVEVRGKSVRVATVPISSARSAVRAARQARRRERRTRPRGARAAASMSPAASSRSIPRAVRCTAQLDRDGAARYSTESTISRERLGNWRRYSARSAFSLATRSRVLVRAAGRLVQPPRLQDVEVGGVDARHAGRDLVAEVGVGLPLDGALGDRLDDRRGVRDQHLLRALYVVLPAHPAGVHDVDLDRVALEQLQEAVALVVVVHREERVGARDAQELALLVLAAGRGAGGLAEHEEGRGLRALQLGHRRDHVLVAVQDQQEVGRSMSAASAASMSENENTARPFLV